MPTLKADAPGRRRCSGVHLGQGELASPGATTHSVIKSFLAHAVDNVRTWMGAEMADATRAA